MSNPEAIKVCDNIDFAAAGLCFIANLSAKEAERLQTFKRVHLQGTPYTIRYLPGKYLALNKGFGESAQTAEFSDMGQYDSSFDVPGQRRAKQAAELGRELYQAFRELGFKPENFISPANIFIKQKYKLEKYSLPTMDNMGAMDGLFNTEVLTMADKCLRGNWVEAYQRGYWPHAFDYDVNSCYVYHASQLLDLRRGRWIKSDNYEPGAVYGFADVEVNIEQDYSPVLLNMAGLNYAVKGIYETTLSKQKIDFVNAHLGYATPLNGVWWLPDREKSQYHPLAGISNWLYEKKTSTAGLKRQIIKGMMVGATYGVFLQRKGDLPGEHYLSPWGAVIEDNAQIQVAQTCLDNGIKPLHIAVDGIVTTKPMPTPSDSEIGAWRLTHEGACLVHSAGLVAFEGKHGEGDFSLSLEWLKNAIEAEPQAKIYTKSKKSMVTLGVAVSEQRIDSLGSIEERGRSVYIGGEQKRFWKSTPQNGGDLLAKHFTSEPWDYTTLKLLTA